MQVEQSSPNGSSFSVGWTKFCLPEKHTYCTEIVILQNVSFGLLDLYCVRRLLKNLEKNCLKQLFETLAE